MTMATYVTNLVQLIGLGIAIDYSLLIVYRFREELGKGGSKDDAIRANDDDGRARGDLLRRDRRHRSGPPAVHAAPVHALDGSRRLPDSARLDPRRRRRCKPAL
jgi:hypothetical protein